MTGVLRLCGGVSGQVRRVARKAELQRVNAAALDKLQAEMEEKRASLKEFLEVGRCRGLSPCMHAKRP